MTIAMMDKVMLFVAQLWIAYPMIAVLFTIIVWDVIKPGQPFRLIERVIFRQKGGK